MYQPETPPVFITDSQPLAFGVADANMDFTFESTAGMDEGLATMQALKSPMWWNNTLMPGYVVFYNTFVFYSSLLMMQLELDGR